MSSDDAQEVTLDGMTLHELEPENQSVMRQFRWAHKEVYADLDHPDPRERYLHAITTTTMKKEAMSTMWQLRDRSAYHVENRYARWLLALCGLAYPDTDNLWVRRLQLLWTLFGQLILWKYVIFTVYSVTECGRQGLFNYISIIGNAVVAVTHLTGFIALEFTVTQESIFGVLLYEKSVAAHQKLVNWLTVGSALFLIGATSYSIYFPVANTTTSYACEYAFYSGRASWIIFNLCPLFFFFGAVCVYPVYGFIFLYGLLQNTVEMDNELFEQWSDKRNCFREPVFENSQRFLNEFRLMHGVIRWLSQVLTLPLAWGIFALGSMTVFLAFFVLFVNDGSQTTRASTGTLALLDFILGFLLVLVLATPAAITSKLRRALTLVRAGKYDHSTQEARSQYLVLQTEIANFTQVCGFEVATVTITPGIVIQLIQLLTTMTIFLATNSISSGSSL